MGQLHLCDQNLERWKKAGPGRDPPESQYAPDKANGDWGNYRVDKVDGVVKIGWSPTNKPPVDSSEKGEIEPEWEEKALSGRKTVALPGNEVPL